MATQATEDDDLPGYNAEDGTLYWTLSFYIPYARLGPARKPTDGGIPPLRRAFKAEAALDRLDGSQNDATRKMREAVDPLFNDIADRTRQGKVYDRLLVEGRREQVLFLLPDEIFWKTEGRRFRVRIPDSDQERPAEMRRFWYLHSNGAMSWHVAFALRYREQLEHELAANRVSSLYFLSLLQKLAWPKECDAGNAKPDSTDALLNIALTRPGGPAKARKPFWAELEEWFEIDRAALENVHPEARTIRFQELLPRTPCIEVPGLKTCEARSLFFIQDQQFFNLIQPKTPAGLLIPRRERILDAAFKDYPKWIRAIEADEEGFIELGDAFWRARLREESPPATGTAESDDEFPLPGAAERVIYLFLAGFNQNIIDWANQEASEVLDSLDPIYPSSDEQTEEGFFIRYANPRSLITYVSQSRTLEVGNDHILTCPYAFLIHVLAMNNEHLTRDKEKRAFDVIDWVSDQLNTDYAAEIGEDTGRRAARRRATREELVRVESEINRLRIDSFEHFDRHRYANPFRYDTERDVFEQLEKLRGTSRLEFAHKEALAALNEQVNDLERQRADDERRIEHRADSRLTALFGLIGLSGVGQLLLAIYEYFKEKDPKAVLKWDTSLQLTEALIVAIIVLLIGWTGLRLLLSWLNDRLNAPQ